MQVLKQNESLGIFYYVRGFNNLLLLSFLSKLLQNEILLRLRSCAVPRLPVVCHLLHQFVLLSCPLEWIIICQSVSVLGFYSKLDLLQQGVKKFYHAAQEIFGIPNIKTIVQLRKIEWTALYKGFVYYLSHDQSLKY